MVQKCRPEVRQGLNPLTKPLPNSGRLGLRPAVAPTKEIITNKSKINIKI